jgi:hypothetical protein
MQADVVMGDILARAGTMSCQPIRANRQELDSNCAPCESVGSALDGASTAELLGRLDDMGAGQKSKCPLYFAVFRWSGSACAVLVTAAVSGQPTFECMSCRACVGEEAKLTPEIRGHTQIIGSA